MGEYDFLEKLYSFAKVNGYRVEDLNVGDRRNKRGFYKYVTLALVIPGKENEAEHEAADNETTGNNTNQNTPDGEKEQVKTDEI